MESYDENLSSEVEETCRRLGVPFSVYAQRDSLRKCILALISDAGEREQRTVAWENADELARMRRLRED